MTPTHGADTAPDLAVGVIDRPTSTGAPRTSAPGRTGPGRVSLRRPLDDTDLNSIVGWLSDGSPAAALTSDVREQVSVDSLRDRADR